MSSLHILGVGVVIVLGYSAARAVDAAMADLTRLADMVNTASFVLIDIPAGFAWFSLLFGGLPLALFGLVVERHWSGVDGRRYVRVSYSVLMFQIVSMVFSVLGLLLFGPGFVWALRHGMVGLPGLLPAYLGLQIVASLAAIPLWRRLMSNAVVPPWGISP